MSQNKYYITTPLYYVNAKPHIGTLYSTLLADVSARWQRFSGREVYFLTGTDEHGQKIATAAENAGKKPQEFVDSIVPLFHDMWAKYTISYDQFIRTTDFAHKQTVSRWIEKLKAQGDIYKDVYEGLYCVPCETFVPEEQVGTNESEEKLCPTCRRGLEVIKEENYFFKLSAYQERLLKFYQDHPSFIQPKERINEIISFVKSGLRDLSLSRKSVSWGIPFPGDPEHVVYVWGDALLNYVSALGYLREDQDELFQKFWPANTQVMAKDIVKFHAVYFPAFLMAAGIEPAEKLLVHGYILVNNDKMSKSKGNSIDPGDLAQEFGVDQVRYYLTRYMVTTHDGNFSLEDLAQKIGSDLANGLGNLLQRSASLAKKYNLEKISGYTWSESSLKLKKSCESMLSECAEHLDKLEYHKAYASLWKYIGQVNGYVHENEPWVLGKTNPEKFTEVISAVAQSLYIIAHIIYPVMPNKSKQLLAALGHTVRENKEKIWENSWDVNVSLLVPKEPLFIRPDVLKYKESSTMSEPETKPENKNTPETSVERSSDNKLEKALELPENCITIDDLIKVELAVGLIREAEPVKKSNKLYQFQVDMGSYGQRQILAGIAQFYRPEEIVGKRAIFVANLAPRKMMGTYSQGMMLFAKDDEGGYSLVTVGENIKPGTRLS